MHRRSTSHRSFVCTLLLTVLASPSDNGRSESGTFATNRLHGNDRLQTETRVREKSTCLSQIVLSFCSLSVTLNFPETLRSSESRDRKPARHDLSSNYRWITVSGNFSSKRQLNFVSCSTFNPCAAISTPSLRNPISVDLNPTRGTSVTKQHRWKRGVASRRFLRNTISSEIETTNR